MKKVWILLLAFLLLSACAGEPEPGPADAEAAMQAYRQVYAAVWRDAALESAFCSAEIGEDNILTIYLSRNNKETRAAFRALTPDYSPAFETVPYSRTALRLAYSEALLALRASDLEHWNLERWWDGDTCLIAKAEDPAAAEALLEEILPGAFVYTTYDEAADLAANEAAVALRERLKATEGYRELEHWVAGTGTSRDNVPVLDLTTNDPAVREAFRALMPGRELAFTYVPCKPEELEEVVALVGEALRESADPSYGYLYSYGAESRRGGVRVCVDISSRARAVLRAALPEEVCVLFEANTLPLAGVTAIMPPARLYVAHPEAFIACADLRAGLQADPALEDCFGGMYVDEMGALHVLLTENDEATRARFTALTDYPLTFGKADFSEWELNEACTWASNELYFHLQERSRCGVDLVHNRIIIRTDDPEATRAALESRLPGAFVFEPLTQADGAW